MQKPDHHIFVCGSFRAAGAPQGACNNKGSLDLLGYLESELADRGIPEALVSSTGCLNVCDRGPVLVVYPDNLWYGGVASEQAIDDILDALEDGEVAEEYLLS